MSKRDRLNQLADRYNQFKDQWADADRVNFIDVVVGEFDGLIPRYKSLESGRLRFIEYAERRLAQLQQEQQPQVDEQTTTDSIS